MPIRFATKLAGVTALLVCFTLNAYAQTETSTVANGALQAQPEPSDSPATSDVATGVEDIESRLIGGLGAGDATLTGQQPEPRKVGVLGSYGRTLVALLVVVLAVVLVARVVRPWLQRMRHVQGGQVIEVLARAYVAPRQSLCLVRLGRRLHLIGVSADRIAAVAQVDDPQEIAELLSQCASSRPGSVTREFDRLLQGREKDLLGQDLPANTEPLGFLADTTVRTVDRLRRRLRQMSRSPMSEGA